MQSSLGYSILDAIFFAEGIKDIHKLTVGNHQTRVFDITGDYCDMPGLRERNLAGYREFELSRK